MLVGVVALVRGRLRETFPGDLHPTSFGASLLASATGSFGEEILRRLFLLRAPQWLLPAGRKATTVAILTSSLLFGALPAPAAVLLFGGFTNVSLLFWVWMIGLNGLVGVACALWFLS